ncbi:unnamed protein product [Lepidochelys kempii]
MAASGSSGAGRADNGYGSQQPRRRKGPGALATTYLVIYNVVMTAGWLVIAVGLVRAYLTKGSYHSLYYSIEKPLKFFQTGALLELHCSLFCCPDCFPSDVKGLPDMGCNTQCKGGTERR